MITLHIVGLLYDMSRIHVSTFSSRSLKDVANYLIVIKSFIYDLLSVPCVVFMSVKSRPYRPPGSILVIQLAIFLYRLFFLSKWYSMPTRYKIQQTSFNIGLQDHLESILEFYRVYRSSRRFHQRDNRCM